MHITGGGDTYVIGGGDRYTTTRGWGHVHYN